MTQLDQRKDVQIHSIVLILEQNAHYTTTNPNRGLHFLHKDGSTKLSHTMKFRLTLSLLLVLMQLAGVREVDAGRVHSKLADRRMLSKLTALPEAEYFLAGIRNEETKQPISQLAAKKHDGHRNKWMAVLHQHKHDLMRYRSQFIYGVSFVRWDGFLAQYFAYRCWWFVCTFSLGIIASNDPAFFSALWRVLSGLTVFSSRIYHLYVIPILTMALVGDSAFPFLVVAHFIRTIAQAFLPPNLYDVIDDIFFAPIIEEMLFRRGFEALFKHGFKALGGRPHIFQEQLQSAGKLWFGHYEMWHIVSSFLFGYAHMFHLLGGTNKPTADAIGNAIARTTLIGYRSLTVYNPVYENGGVIASIGAHFVSNFYSRTFCEFTILLLLIIYLTESIT